MEVAKTRTVGQTEMPELLSVVLKDERHARLRLILNLSRRLIRLEVLMFFITLVMVLNR